MTRTPLDPDLHVVLEDPEAPVAAGFPELVAACTAADDHAPFGEHTLLTLDGYRQVQHARLAARRGTRLTGYAVLWEGLDAWYVEVAVDPALRRHGTGSALIDAALEHVAGHGGGTVRAWQHAGGGDTPAGWRTGRTLHVLERDLSLPVQPQPAPAGLTLRTLDTASATDRDAWLTLSNAAFAGHPENGGWTREDLDWRVRAPWTAARRFPVLCDDSGLVAGVWTKVEEPGSGELYVVAVHPCRQGRGLGAVVVAEALRLLAAGGALRALLYVDADNRRAVHLYARQGFTRHHVDRCLEIDVRADPGR